MRFLIHRYFIAFQIVLVSTASFSKETHLICQGQGWWNGENQGKDKFSLTVDPSNGSMYGMPSYRVPGCVTIGEKKSKVKHEVSEENVSLECDNDIASTNWNLNRYTMLLRYSNFHKKGGDIDLGEYKCSKVEKQF